MGIDTSDVVRLIFALPFFGLGLTIARLAAALWIKLFWLVLVTLILHQIDWLVAAYVSGFVIGGAWWYVGQVRRSELRSADRRPRSPHRVTDSGSASERDAIERARMAVARDRALLDADRARLADEQRQLHETRRRFEEEQEKSQRDDSHAVLGLKPGASRQEIIRRYRQLAVQYHPDKAAQASPAIQKLAEQEFVRIKAAYERLVRER